MYLPRFILSLNEITIIIKHYYTHCIIFHEKSGKRSERRLLFEMATNFPPALWRLQIVQHKQSIGSNTKVVPTFKMSATDRLNFSEEKIFKTASESVVKTDGKTKNIIDCKDDIIFLWDAKKKCIRTQNVKVLRRNPSLYQVGLYSSLFFF